MYNFNKIKEFSNWTDYDHWLIADYGMMVISGKERMATNYDKYFINKIEEIDGKLAFHTQGIANNLEDPIVYGKQINGVVQTKMYFLTLICTIFNNKYVFYFCGIIPLSIYAGFRIFKGRHDKDIEREN